MSDYFISLLAIAVSGLFSANFIFTQSLGLCPFLGVSRKMNSAVGMGVAVVFVCALSGAVISVVYNYLLNNPALPFNFAYLKIPVNVLIIAALVQLMDIIIKRASPTLYNSLGIYLALITTNCCVLGSVNLSIAEGHDVFQSFLNGVFIGGGFLLALILMAGVRERLEKSDIPKAFKGFPIALLAAALMSMAFFGIEGFKMFG